jgi:succinate dehydrogenase/fumarate reductase flavoprotein subunit
LCWWRRGTPTGQQARAEEGEASRRGGAVARAFGAARIPGTDYNPIRGLYAAGELVGGLFYFNYPGGTGLMAGSVFGRIAGNRAGRAGKN